MMKKQDIFYLGCFVGTICSIVLHLFGFSAASLVLTICLSVILIAFCMKTAIRENGFFQPIVIFNIVAAAFFVLRPIHILLAGKLTAFSYFKYYFMQHGDRAFSELPFSEASLIGLIGILIANYCYYTIAKNNRGCIQKRFKRAPEYRIQTNRMCSVYIVAALVLWVLYLHRAYVQHKPISFVYILWAYVLTVVLAIHILNNGKLTKTAVICVVIACVSLASLGNRQLAVSLLLCVFATLVTIKENTNVKPRKILALMIAIGIAGAVVITWYASIRYKTAFKLNNLFDDLLSEFGMYDMLVLAIDHKQRFGDPFLYGYNYLCLFNWFIPGVNIEFFDYRLVQIVFGGLLGGGIPISLLGSFYYNFGYVGLAAGSALFGFFMAGVYFRNLKNKAAEAFLHNVIFLTFTYDVMRVGDVGRELINFLVLWGILKIAMAFIPKRFAYID